MCWKGREKAPFSLPHPVRVPDFVEEQRAVALFPPHPVRAASSHNSPRRKGAWCARRRRERKDNH